MIEGGEELGNVKCNNTSVALLEPASIDDVCKVEASIGGGLLSDACKLVGV